MRRYLTMAEAAEFLPFKRSPCTLWRWCVRGVHGPHGNRIVQLRHVCLGRRLMTTEAWLDEFFEQLTRTRTVKRGWPAGRRQRGQGERGRRLSEADAVLRRAGIVLPKPGGELRQVGAQVRRKRRV